MLGFKMAGAVIMVLAGWCFGKILCSRERLKRDQVGRLMDLVRFVRSQISTYLLPIRDIIRNCDASLADLRGADESADNVELQYENIVDDVARQRVAEYFSQAGRGDRHTELRLCDHYISLLEVRYREICVECPRRCRLIMTLCLCGTAGVALLLL